MLVKIKTEGVISVLELIVTYYLCFSTNYFLLLQIFGPVLVVLQFRTAKEAIALSNNTIYGLGGSVWTESLPLALEAALSIKAGTVWINSHNLFDSAAGFGGYKQSGYGRDGGKEVRKLINCLFVFNATTIFIYSYKMRQQFFC